MTDELDDDDFDDFDEDDGTTVDEMVVENGMMLHSLISVLIRKGIVSGDEIDAEMKQLYEAIAASNGEDDED